MVNKTKLTISCISAIILSLGCLTGAVAQTAPYTYENGTGAASRGIIEISGAKFDSTDLEKIYTEVSTGKNNVATAITAKGGTVTPTGTGGIYKFSDLVDGVNSTYTAGQNNVWTSIQNAASSKGKTGETLAAYQSANSVDSLYSAIDADNISYAEDNCINLGLYVIDLSSYGVASTYNTVGAYSDFPTDYRFGIRTAYTFTYNIKTISRFYGIDYTQLTADDFISGYKNIPTNRVGTTSTAPDWAHVFTGTILNEYDAANGILTLSNIYSGCITANNGEGNYKISNAEFTSGDIVCMLIPRSVVVD